VDFVCRTERLIVELDGVHHAEADQVEYDQIRTEFLVSQGYKVLRFWNTEVEHSLSSTLEAINAALKAPLPLGEGLG
jgi:very-short-patch-repair endonuclease